MSPVLRHDPAAWHPVRIPKRIVDKESVPEVLQILAEAGASQRSPFIAVRSDGGAVSRVPGDATAYAHRQAELMFVTTAAGPKVGIEVPRDRAGTSEPQIVRKRQWRLTGVAEMVLSLYAMADSARAARARNRRQELPQARELPARSSTGHYVTTPEP